MRTFDKLFIFTGILLQMLVFYCTGQTVLSLISGIAGTVAVVVCSLRKFWPFFVFSFIQCITYIIIAYNSLLWGEVGINVFYFITLFIALYTWNKNYDGDKVEAKQLSVISNIIVFVITILGVLGLWCILLLTNDSQPFVDSFTTFPAIIAQVLLVLKYREQWIYWVIIDIASIYMWGIAGNLCMVAQYIYWTVNCIYGYCLWSKK